MKKRLNSHKSAFYIFILPALLLYTTFFLIPLVMAFYYSFFNYDGYQVFQFIGFKNYTSFITDRVFYGTVGRTLLYAVVNVPFKVIIPLALSLLLTTKLIRFRTLPRTVIYIPVLLSALIVGITMNWMFGQEYGLINFLIKLTGGKALQWALNPTLATIVIGIASNWASAGFYMVIFIGGINEIPSEIYEASDIDGANGRQKLFWVTLPMIRPTTLLVLLLTTNDLLKEFALVQGITQGGPGDSTTFLIQYIYDKAFHTTPAQYGYASAISIFAMVLFLIIALIQFKANKGGEVE